MTILITNSGRAAVVESLVAREIFIAIGTGDAVWGDTPPPPALTDTELVNPLAIVRTRYKNFVTQTPSGSLESSDGLKWDISTDPTPYLYADCQLDYADADGEKIREYAYYIDPTINSSVPMGQDYIPISDVDDFGTLFGLSRIAPIHKILAQQTIGHIIAL